VQGCALAADMAPLCCPYALSGYQVPEHRQQRLGVAVHNGHGSSEGLPQSMGVSLAWLWSCLKLLGGEDHMDCDFTVGRFAEALIAAGGTGIQ
jgi:hypothetical protein